MREKYRPDVAKQSSEKKTSIQNVLLLILAGAAGGVALYEAPQNEKHLSSQKPAIHAEPSSGKSEIKTEVKQEVKPEEKRPEQRRVVSKEEITAAQSKLQELLAQAHAPSARQSLEILNPNSNIREACRVASDWMIKESEPLDLLWWYVHSREFAWPPSLKAQFDAMLAATKTLSSISSDVPTDMKSLDAKLTQRLEQKNPLKCGWSLYAASLVVSLADVQKQSLDIIDGVADLVTKDLADPEQKVRDEAYSASVVMAHLLESVLTTTP